MISEDRSKSHYRLFGKHRRNLSAFQVLCFSCDFRDSINRDSFLSMGGNGMQSSYYDDKIWWIACHVQQKGDGLFFADKLKDLSNKVGEIKKLHHYETRGMIQPPSGGM